MTPVYELDDEPRPPMLEFFLRMHELQTRGRDIEPVKTFESELRKMCESRGYRFCHHAKVAPCSLTPFRRAPLGAVLTQSYYAVSKSAKSHTRAVIPASIAGVTRSLL